MDLQGNEPKALTHNVKKRAQPSDDIERSVIDWAGEAPKKPLIWDGKNFKSRWGGKNNDNFGFKGDINRKWGIVYDYRTQRSQTFYLKGTKKPDFKNHKLPPLQDVTDQFEALPKATNDHPYLKRKKIQIPEGLDLRILKENILIVPVYSKDNVMISWQRIFPIKVIMNEVKKDKLFKEGNTIAGQTPHLVIGKKTEYILVCEGLATGISLHKITGMQVYCAFSKGNLDGVVKLCKQKHPKLKVRLMIDHDGKNTHKTEVKTNALFEVVCPDKEGDFNDFQFNPIEIVKLKKACGEEDIYDSSKDLTQRQIIEHIKRLKDSYYYLADKTSEIPPAFHDDKMIVPMRDWLLLTGDTESGKTAFTLKQCEGYLKQGKKVVIWEHSETNRFNRLNRWIKDNKLEEYRDNGSLVMSPSRKEILDHFAPGVIIAIDDTDSFFRIQKPIERREVADTLDDLSWCCQLVGFSAICAHYQTKTSKKETNKKLRSGGGMTWVNKARHAVCIEKGVKDIKFQDKANECNEEWTEAEAEESSFLTIQKGNRPGAKESSWWLKDDYSIGEPIKDKQVDDMIKDKAEGEGASEDEMGIIRNIIRDYMSDSQHNTMPMKEFYRVCSNNIPGKPQKFYRALKRLKGYKIDSKGFGKDKYYFITTI